MEKTSQHLKSELGMDHLTSASYPEPIDRDLDLLNDQDGEVWEEWIEDEDFMAASIESQPSLVTIPSWEEYTMRRQLNPLELKPTIPRARTESVNTSAQWNKFAPEHIGIISNNSQHFDQFLANLDI